MRTIDENLNVIYDGVHTKDELLKVALQKLRDFETLEEAAINGIYFKYNDKICYLDPYEARSYISFWKVYSSPINLSDKWSEEDKHFMDLAFEMQDYGQKWALSKGELFGELTEIEEGKFHHLQYVVVVDDYKDIFTAGQVKGTYRTKDKKTVYKVFVGTNQGNIIVQEEDLRAIYNEDIIPSILVKEEIEKIITQLRGFLYELWRNKKDR